ncbi:MAG: alpha/beta fold hydrolase [Phreatobacter sp.]|uniref:alpha/beta hydrolase n=1 Tax=Phreatobacter sp. TaxID=1966341 RepID=UPI001A3F6C2C|nr:alpha/beta fold hydrolase [Phreatobacter sp.]MBL8569202.1 alpha/beta fold hydrolase [Phreatobacter sp.]
MRFLIALPLAIALLIVTGLAAVIALSRPKAPPPMPAMEAAGQIIGRQINDLPPYAFLTARDGTRLGYRFFEGRPGGGIAVVVHGSTGLSASMGSVGRALAAKGIASYVLDLRGHGESGPLGDIGYRGQLEDDMADLLAMIDQRHPGEKRILVGHSLGGAFAFRIAAGPLGERFDATVATSPFLSPETSVSRPNSGGWADAAVPRILALTLLDAVGISAFGGLPAVAYAVPPDAPGKRASIYSHRLLANMSLPRDWRAMLATIRKPAAILIGADDELFRASAYAAAVTAANPRIAVEVLPATDHMGTTLQPGPLTQLAETAARLRDAAPAR